MTDLYRVRTQFLGLPGGAGLSTIFFAVPVGSAQDAATAVDDFWSEVRGIMSANVTIQGIPAVDTIDASTGSPTGTTGTTRASVSGSLSDNPLPWATQMLVSWYTGTYIGGRQVSGKMYIPGITESQCDGSFVTEAVSAVAGNLTPLLSNPLAVPMVYSRLHANAYPVASASAHRKPAVLRGRRG